jgi:hypothetical protein
VGCARAHSGTLKLRVAASQTVKRSALIGHTGYGYRKKPGVASLLPHGISLMLHA